MIEGSPEAAAFSEATEAFAAAADRLTRARDAARECAKRKVFADATADLERQGFVPLEPPKGSRVGMWTHAKVDTRPVRAVLARVEPLSQIIPACALSTTVVRRVDGVEVGKRSPVMVDPGRLEAALKAGCAQ
jgi:hypothetical protein